jgi:chromate reductase, NAD(P)H dehydrogenase (quinone)
MTVKLLAFAGSSRRGSFNQRVLAIGRRAAKAAGAEVAFIDLKELDLPHMDQDVEAESGLPAGARRFKAALSAADGFLIATPEYNSSFPALLKDALDWASRRESRDEKPLAPFAGKPVGLLSASPGVYGGLRAQLALRTMLQNMQMLVVPTTAANARLKDDSFDDDGDLRDEAAQQRVQSVARELVALAAKLRQG